MIDYACSLHTINCTLFPLPLIVEMLAIHGGQCTVQNLTANLMACQQFCIDYLVRQIQTSPVDTFSEGEVHV